jgi:hypothetical protein
VIFLDQLFETHPYAGMGANEVFEPCFDRSGSGLARGRLDRLTRLLLAEHASSNNSSEGLTLVSGQTHFEDKHEHESVSRSVTLCIRSVSCQEIQLKSLILAQPERWRRG